MPSKISIIIPIIRPDKAKNCLSAIHKNAGVPNSEYEVVMEEDESRIGAPKMVAKLVKRARHNLVMFLGDDTIPEPNFMVNALKWMERFPGGWGIVGLNTDGGNKQHWLAHKDMLPHLGGEFFHTGYIHCFCDDELKDVAVEMDRWVFAPNAKVHHDHPFAKGKDPDEDLKRVYSQEAWNRDKRLYIDRRRRRHRENGWVKLAIGLPHTDETIFTEFFKTWTLMRKPDYVFCMPVYFGPIEDMRNQIVSQALNQCCTHLLMMDTDQQYPTDTVEKLWGHRDKDVVGGMVHRRYPLFDAILYRGIPNRYVHVPDEECYSGNLVEVDATGCGCILYNTEVFIEIQPPWFEQNIGPEGKPVGEDINFCAKLRGKGYKIHVDTSIDIGHITRMVVNRSTYELYKKMKGYTWAKEPVNDNNSKP